MGSEMCIRDRCMLLLGKAHIGEVQSSIWDEHTRKVFEDAHITLL